MAAVTAGNALAEDDPLTGGHQRSGGFVERVRAQDDLVGIDSLQPITRTQRALHLEEVGRGEDVSPW